MGSVVNSTLVGRTLGFPLAMGVGYLITVIAGIVTTIVLKVGSAFDISTAVSFGARALEYASEELINGRTPFFRKAMMYGGFMVLEEMINFAIEGIIGSVENIGTKGKFFISKE